MDFKAIGNEIAGNDIYKRRVEYALFSAAVNVMSEVNTTPSHAARVTYGAKVLAGQADVRAAVIASLTNSTLAAANTADSIPDSDIQFAVNSLFNALAGIGT